MSAPKIVTSQYDPAEPARPSISNELQRDFEQKQPRDDNPPQSQPQDEQLVIPPKLLDEIRKLRAESDQIRAQRDREREQWEARDARLRASAVAAEAACEAAIRTAATLVDAPVDGSGTLSFSYELGDFVYS